FQFGMNWSNYSRYVGDIFGAPLAVEALLTFFLESTFLGLWIFGWDRLPKKVHLLTIWLAAVGTALSAYMILAANSWMQHPVGYTFDAEKNRAQMTSFTEVLFQNTAVIAWLHTISAAFLTAGALMAGVSLWLIMRKKVGAEAMARATLKVGAAVAVVAAAALGITGDQDAKIMVQQQPMKMAAAEALYETAQPAPFSLFTIGTLDGSEPLFSLDIPNALSFLATGTFDGKVEGINNLEQQYQQQYGPEFGLESYTPYIPVTYWGFRLMIGFGMLAALFAVIGWWAARKGRTPTSKWLIRMAILAPFLPLLANSAGWIFTEMGRQPWIVFGLMPTAEGVSPGVGAAEVLTSLIVFTLLYGALAVVEVGLLLRAIKQGPPEVVVDPFADHGDPDRELTVTY
ncbi:MAG: cytochrome ubiquinol oxidase subunit I, partial [Microthrixaceae bacterium]|nr:cytochrome ubiquinol oxidase subunit I [Microthrixaceae bacterium]